MMVVRSGAVDVQTRLVTFAEFEQLPDPPVGYLELHHGQVVLIPSRKKLHVRIQQALLVLLRPLDDFGFLSGHHPFRPAPEYESWTADIGFVAQARWDADHHEYFMGAPDLVIEVLSRSNTMDEVLDRQDVCLSNGCLSFWVVDPKRQVIMVTAPDRTTWTYGRQNQVPLPGPWNGTVEVAAVFRP
jgi:Uma2 family endonuclease